MVLRQRLGALRRGVQRAYYACATRCPVLRWRTLQPRVCRTETACATQCAALRQRRALQQDPRPGSTPQVKYKKTVFLGGVISGIRRLALPYPHLIFGCARTGFAVCSGSAGCRFSQPGICLRVRYAMRGKERSIIVKTFLAQVSLRARYAMPGTDVANGTICLRACYAMSGTAIASA
eukprot:2714381-Rhodomonas_salina.3